MKRPEGRCALGEGSTARGQRPVHRDLSSQGPGSGRVDNGVTCSGNLDSITTKWTIDCSVICILVRDEGGRGPSLSCPSISMATEEGKKQRGLEYFAQEPLGIKQKSSHSHKHHACNVCV